MPKNNFVLIRGGGDLATGIALRLHRAGINILITELAQPLAVRRTVSFAEAVYEGRYEVEGVKAKLIEANQLSDWDDADEIPVLIDPNADILLIFDFPVVIDARLMKQTPDPLPRDVPLHIGLGPGFCAGRDCHAVIETRRSHTLGRVYWNGTTQPDSGQPDGDPRRVLRAPADGTITNFKRIGDGVKEGDTLAVIDGQYPIISQLSGVVRGIIREGLHVSKGLKIGDVDARGDRDTCYLVSDKALAIGGGVLEAILSKGDFRKTLYSSLEGKK